MASVEIITTMYNDSLLAPLFLRHYSYADRITIFYDQESSDNTLDLISDNSKVEVIPFRFPDKFDDEIKILNMNRRYIKTECDWVVGVDSDEFIFYSHGGQSIADLKVFLDGLGTLINAVAARMLDVYRHIDDNDLDFNQPPLFQRRHGQAPLYPDKINWKYVLLKNDAATYWSPGCHRLRNMPTCRSIANFFIRKGLLPGKRRRMVQLYPYMDLMLAHWQKADPIIVKERYIKTRKGRMGDKNIQRGHADYYLSAEEGALLDVCREHENDPQLF